MAPLNRSLRIHNPATLNTATKNTVGAYYLFKSAKSSATTNNKQQFNFASDGNFVTTAFLQVPFFHTDVYYAKENEKGQEFLGDKYSIETDAKNQLQVNIASGFGPFSFGLGMKNVKGSYTAQSFSNVRTQSIPSSSTAYLAGGIIQIFSFYLSGMAQVTKENSTLYSSQSYANAVAGLGFRHGFPGFGLLRGEASYSYEPENILHQDSNKGIAFRPKKTDLNFDAEFEFDFKSNSTALLGHLGYLITNENFNYATASTRKSTLLSFGVGIHFFSKHVAINFIYGQKNSTFGNFVVSESTNYLGAGLQF